MQRCFQFKLLDALKIQILSILLLCGQTKKKTFQLVFLIQCSHHLWMVGVILSLHSLDFRLWNVLLAYFCQEFLFYFIVFYSLSSRPLCLQQKLSLTLRYQMYILYQLCISFMSSLAENKWVLGGIHQGLKLLCLNSPGNYKTLFSNNC